MKFLYKLSRSAIPCALITLCVGWCYAFSLFIPSLVDVFNASRSAIQFTFCLNIFFLGMGAATFGSLVERNLRCAAFVSTVLLALGLCIGGISVNVRSLMLLYTGIGVLCGLAEGCGYVVPVKNLLMWFKKSKNKALITAVSIILFGLGSTLCSFIFKSIFDIVGIDSIFFVLAGVYFIPMSIGSFLIRKPRFAELQLKKITPKFSYMRYLKDPFFLRSWMFMFLNISMGLILIGSCTMMLNEAGISKQMIITIMMLCGLFNGGGRLVFPALSDFMKKRIVMWCTIVGIEIALMTMPMISYPLIGVTVILANATYGAAFACLPSVLSDHYGDKELSFVHGFCLSSWAMASVFAFIVTTFVLQMFSSYHYVIYVIIAVHFVNFINTVMCASKETKCEDNKQ